MFLSLGLLGGSVIKIHLTSSNILEIKTEFANLIFCVSILEIESGGFLRIFEQLTRATAWVEICIRLRESFFLFKTEVIFETTLLLQKRLHFSFEVTTNFVCTKHKMFYSAFTSHWWGARHKRLHSHALHHLRQNFVLTSGRHLISTGDASKTF